jgi:predicted RNase H-like nuclease (RuvC/YqgF family)
MRSKNEKKYARYYLLLEEVVKYYSDYQTEVKNKYIIKYKDKINKQKEMIIEKDDNITKLQLDIQQLIKSNEDTNNKLAETSNEVKQVLKINKRLDKHSRILEDKLNDANYKLDDVKDDLVDANNKLDLTCKKLNIAVDSRITEPFNKYKLEDFVLLKNRNRKLPYRYYAIRAQTKYVNNKIEKMITLKNYKQLLRINNVPNAVNIWNCLKDSTKNKVEYVGNELKLLTVDENDFIRMVNEVYDKRKEINVDDDAEYSDTE